jgi:hypothetical protein
MADELEAANAALAALIQDLESGEVRSGLTLAARLERFLGHSPLSVSAVEIRTMHEDAASLIDGFQRGYGNGPQTDEARQKILAKLREIKIVPPREPPKNRNRGGRPPKYDWDAFTREIIRTANSPDGLPTDPSGGLDRAAIQRQMLDWCAELWPDVPAESVVREKLSKILP